MICSLLLYAHERVLIPVINFPIVEMLSVNEVRKRLSEGFLIYEQYKWLMNAFVLDFFTEDHWSKLPKSWNNMKNLSTTQLAELLDHEKHSQTFLFPLSIIALKTLFRSLNVSRKQNITTKMNDYESDIMNDIKLVNMFWKNVKLKKRHEIPIMAKICKQVASKCGTSYVVDIGSGLGHLSRMLTYGYDFQVCAIEAQTELSQLAGILDIQFASIFEKKYGARAFPKHVNMIIESSISDDEFVKIVRTSFGVEEQHFKFGIVGLHPCGDLGPTLLHLYERIPNIAFINVVGCCYMKLTNSENNSNPGFPLSRFCIENNAQLCYHSQEIACHAIESYISKLFEGEHWKLKIHAYRATIEKILIEIDPQYKHIPLANVKYMEGLDFARYCDKATSKFLGRIIEPNRLKSQDISSCLEQWKTVVIFYSLRLFFAPLIESLILYDRLLFLMEKGNHTALIPGFETKISPRMHVLQGWK